MQRAVNTTLEEEVWFAYIHCRTTDVFSPPVLLSVARNVEKKEIFLDEKIKKCISFTESSKPCPYNIGWEVAT
jgi:hypothetical protein